MNQLNKYILDIPLLLMLLPFLLLIMIMLEWKKMQGSNRTNSVVAILILFTAFISGASIKDKFPMSLHMVQHIIILLILPPLLWNMIPDQVIQKWMQIKWMNKLFTILSNPVIAYTIGMIVMWLVNIPMLKSSHQSHDHHAMTSIGLISLSGNAFVFLQLIAGMIYSLPVFSPIERLRLMPLQGIIYLFLSCLGCSILGIFIALNPANSGSIDLQTSGLIMWIPGCFVYISKALITLIGFFKNKKLAETY